MDKVQVLRMLGCLIQDIADRDQKWIDEMFKEGKAKFRQYQRIEGNEHQLRALDLTIEM